MGRDNNHHVKLFNKLEGVQRSDRLCEQYKMYLEGAERISDRRQQMLSYFITINTALTGVIGISNNSLGASNVYSYKYLLSLIGIVICLVFYKLITSYRQINSVKFAIIHEVEKKLPLNIYDYEWDQLGRGKDPKIYSPFSHVESVIPLLFTLSFIILGVAPMFLLYFNP